jgi:hypothetical protein
MNDRIADTEILRRGIRFRDLTWDGQRQRLIIGTAAFTLRASDHGELSVQHSIPGQNGG